MFNANRGYVGYSMSVRAAAAYDDGEKPLSKWTKTKIINAISEIIEEENLNLDIDLIKKLTLKELRENVLEMSSWHHTGKFFNETDFYSINTESLEEMDEAKIRQIISERPPRKPRKKKNPVLEKEIERRVKAEYKEQISARRSKTVNSYGVIKGNWFYSDHGCKKYVYGKYFNILCEEKDFGVKYIIWGKFEENEKVNIKIEGRTYPRRKVRSDNKGLYVIVNSEKCYKDEFRRK